MYFFRLSKTWESSSGPKPSRASIESGGVYAGFAAISSEGSLPPGEEIASLQFPRPKMRSISAETARGWKSAGGACSPVHQLVSQAVTINVFFALPGFISGLAGTWRATPRRRAGIPGQSSSAPQSPPAWRYRLWTARRTASSRWRAPACAGSQSSGR